MTSLPPLSTDSWVAAHIQSCAEEREVLETAAVAMRALTRRLMAVWRILDHCHVYWSKSILPVFNVDNTPEDEMFIFKILEIILLSSSLFLCYPLQV